MNSSSWVHNVSHFTSTYDRHMTHVSHFKPTYTSQVSDTTPTFSRQMSNMTSESMTAKGAKRHESHVSHVTPTYNSQMWRDNSIQSTGEWCDTLVEDSTGQKAWESCVIFWVISHSHTLHTWVTWHPDSVDARVTWTIVEDSTGQKTCESCVTCESYHPYIYFTRGWCDNHITPESTTAQGKKAWESCHVYIYLASEGRDTHILSRHKSDVTLESMTA